MRGFPNYLRSDAGIGLVVLFLSVVISLAGCAGSEQPSKAEAPKGTLAEFLAAHEPTFRPSEYKLDFKLIRAEEAQQFNALHSATVYLAAVPETIPGFRIQVLLTQEIDEANTALLNLEQQLPEESAYMAYDAPYYKIRVGNFPERATANALLKRLVGLGYKEAWIVPENVLKNPPPKLPDTFIEPKRFIDNNR
jgi:hypothetical protein